MSARARAQLELEARIEKLVSEFEISQDCEVSSLWIEHTVAPARVEVTATTREKVKVA